MLEGAVPLPEGDRMRFVREQGGAFYLSYSRLERYDRCPLAYRLVYLDKVPVPENESLLFGGLVHKVLERYYSEVVAGRYAGPTKTERLEEIFRDAWRESPLSDPAHFEEGLDLIRRYAEKNPAVDYRVVAGIEKEFAVDIEGFRVVGFLDRVERRDGTVEVIDYKTTRNLFSYRDLKGNLQLSIYALAVRELFPDAQEVRLSLYLLRHDLKMTTRRSDEELRTVRDFIVSQGAKIRDETEWPARLAPSCVFCDVKEHCAAFQNARRGKATFTAERLDDLEAVAREREELAAAIKAMTDRKNELDTILKTHLKERDHLVLAGREYRLSHAGYARYPIEAVLRLLEEIPEIAPNEVLAVDKRSLEARLRLLEEEMAAEGREEEFQRILARFEGIKEVEFRSRLTSKVLKKRPVTFDTDAEGEEGGGEGEE